MKKTIKQRFFLSLCLLMLFSLFGGCNLAWAQRTETITLADGTYKSGTIVWAGNCCTITQEQGSGTDKVNKSYVKAPRWYKNHVITFAAKVGYTLTGVTIDVTDRKYVDPLSGSTYSFGASASASGTTVTITTSGDFSVTMSAQSRISSITVSYVANNEPALETNPDGPLSFGNVETSSSKQLSFTLSGQNLTADASLSITGTDAGYFSVAPTSVVSQTDGTIVETPVTVTYAPTAAGTHTATLTIASGTTIKEISLSGTGISSSPVTVTFNAGANGTCATASLTETAAGAGVILPACVANEGYVFGGWSTSETPTSADVGQAGETYYPSADCTLYAYYKQQYTVTIEEPANGTIEVKHGENVVNSGVKFLAGDVLTITATPAEGYKFRYVQVEDGSTHTYTASNVKEWTMAEANITISAKFDEITYSTITKVVNGVSTPELVENGTEIPFANPDAASIPTGYVFMGWTETPVVGKQDDAPTLVSSPVTASTDATYYAVFAVSKRTGNEVWEEITTVPEPGTYAILSESYFMKAEITSSKRFAYGDATPEISTTSPATLTTAPASDCIWEITKPDEYYRIANGSQYAGGTSAKNEGALLDDASRDLAKWTIEHDGSEFSVSNYGRSIASKDKNNKYLRNNVSYGWACYGSGTGKAPRLFKKTNAMVLTDYCTTIPDVELAVGATGYATLYYSNFDLVVPEYTEAYTFGSVDGELMESKRYDEGTVIPAGEAVVVYTINTVPCTLNFKKGIATLARDASSQLAGTDEETAITPDADYYFYGLSLNSSNELNSVGFYWMVDGGAAFTNGAHKAYLKIKKSEFASTQPVKGFAFKGTTTGVESVESSNHAPQTIYDLAGRRVSKAEKGIYIINGKKVIK